MKHLQHKQFPNYYGIVCTPLFKKCFIKGKDSYDRCIKKILENGMRCVNIGSESANVIQYQRYLVEHLFNRLFLRENELSTVLRVATESKTSNKLIEVYCYIEDLVNRPKEYRPISALMGNYVNHSLYVEENGRKLEIAEESLLHSLLS